MAPLKKPSSQKQPDICKSESYLKLIIKLKSNLSQDNYKINYLKCFLDTDKWSYGQHTVQLQGSKKKPVPGAPRYFLPRRR